MPLKDFPEPAKVLSAADVPEVDSSLVGDRQTHRALQTNEERFNEACGTDGGESVDCDNGKVRGTNTDCSVACGGQCCFGDQSCNGFTGRVCKDGMSCFGSRACRDAKINFVVDSCDGEYACQFTGRNAPVGLILNSCKAMDSNSFGLPYGMDHGDFSCEGVAMNPNGQVGNIIDSCKGDRACNGLAHGSFATRVGDISGACIGWEACMKVGTNGADVDSCCNSGGGPRGTSPHTVVNGEGECCMDVHNCHSSYRISQLPAECTVSRCDCCVHSLSALTLH